MSIFSSQNRRKWLKALKWTAIVAGSLVALLLFAVTVAVSYLTPERLIGLSIDVEELFTKHGT